MPVSGAGRQGKSRTVLLSQSIYAVTDISLTTNQQHIAALKKEASALFVVNAVARTPSRW